MSSRSSLSFGRTRAQSTSLRQALSSVYPSSQPVTIVQPSPRITRSRPTRVESPHTTTICKPLQLLFTPPGRASNKWIANKQCYTACQGGSEECYPCPKWWKCELSAMSICCSRWCERTVLWSMFNLVSCCLSLHTWWWIFTHELLWRQLVLWPLQFHQSKSDKMGWPWGRRKYF